MNKIFVSDLKEGLSFESIFLCSNKSLMTDKNGKPYLKLLLTDRTGSIESRIWDKAPDWNKNFQKLDYVWAKGNVVNFQGHLQFNVITINGVPEEKVNPTDFIPHTQKDIEQMYAELLELVRGDIKNPWIQKLLLSILADPQIAPLFKHAPAAKSNHHAWIGGLLEHDLQLCKVARDVCRHYPKVNQDLVIAGLILHDIGKIEELSWEKHLEYTDKGRLIGHLIIGVEIILQKAAQIPDFPTKLLWHLQHLILAHHGQLDYGSPKEPMTMEAIMVHFLDNMDSKLQAFLDILARETDQTSDWSSQNFVFGRPLYKRTPEDIQASLSGSAVKPAKSVEPQAAPKQNVPAQAQRELQKPQGQVKSSQAKPASTKPATRPAPSPQAKKAHSKDPLTTNLGDLLNAQFNKKVGE